MKKAITSILFGATICMASAQWTQVPFPTDADLISVKFLDAQNGYVSISDSLYKTTDGGAFWQAAEYPISGTFLIKSINAMDWTDMDHGFFCGDWGQCFSTTDGGTTIQKHSVPDSSAAFTDVDRDLYAISFPTNSTGWVCGTNGRIFKTSDGGLSWTAQSSGTSETLRAIGFIDAQNGYAAGHNKTLLKTTNGGSTWTIVPISDPFFGIFKTMKVLSPTHAYFADEAGNIAMTSDGSTINKLSYGSGSSMFGISGIDVINDNQACVVGKVGKIAQTQNNGSIWENHSSGTSENLNSVSFVNANLGWASGNNGILLKFSNSVLSINSEENQNDEFAVFPNPTVDFIQINPKNMDDFIQWKLYNTDGKIMKSSNTKNGSQQVNMNDLNNGIYFLTINKNGSETDFRKTIIKQ